MKNVRRYLKGSLVAKAIPHDAELKAHLERQMDDHFGASEQWTPREDTFDDGQLAKAAIAENIVSALMEGDASKDMVNLPPHYAKLAIEPMRYAVENKFDIFQFSVNKYIARWRDKGGKQDLLKARRCLDMYIKFENGDPDWWKGSSYGPIKA